MHIPGPYTSVGPSGHGAEVVVVATARTTGGGGEGEACCGMDGLTGACGMLGFGWLGPEAGAGAPALYG